MARLTRQEQWQFRIERRLLRAALGLSDKIDAKFERVYECVPIPLGYRYVKSAEVLEDVTIAVHFSFGGGTTMLPKRFIVTDVMVTKGSGSVKHRVFVKCPECGKFVPAGRLHQHIGTGTCK